MSDNRLEVKMAPRSDVVRQKNVDVDADIRVHVDTRLTPLGIAGVAVMAVGAVAAIVGSVLFSVGYDPQGTPAGIAEATVLALAASITLLFVGGSMFFHGRTIMGAGSLQRVRFDTAAHDGNVTVANPSPGIVSFGGAVPEQPAPPADRPAHSVWSEVGP